MRITAEQYRRIIRRGDSEQLTVAQIDALCRETEIKRPAPREGPVGTERKILWLEMPVKGKARPRIYQEGEQSNARNPAGYARWLRNARRQLEAQWGGRNPLERLERLIVTFWGGSRANDGDNGIGSVMDAMTKAGIILDDNLKRIPRGAWEWQPSDVPRIQIELEWRI